MNNHLLRIVAVVSVLNAAALVNSYVLISDLRTLKTDVKLLSSNVKSLTGRVDKIVGTTNEFILTRPSDVTGEVRRAAHN